MKEDTVLRDPFHAPVPPLEGAGRLRRWLVARAARHLQHLAPGESVRVQVPIWYARRAWLLAVTTQRLLLLRYPLVGPAIEHVVRQDELQSCGFRIGCIARLRARTYRGPEYALYMPSGDVIPAWAAVARARAE